MPDKADTPSDSEVATPLIQEAEFVASTARDMGHHTEAKAIDALVAAFVGMRKNRDNLRVYLAERTEQRDAARDECFAAEVRSKRAAAVMQAVIDHAIRPPALVERMLAVAPGKREGHEEAEIALWQAGCLANAVRFVAELATMTDIETEFLDAYGLREVARMLQIPDDQGERAPTVPRLYSDEDRERAISAMIAALRETPISETRTLQAMAVDAVAEALGMRRAGA
jgi:hypothetical protein